MPKVSERLRVLACERKQWHGHPDFVEFVRAARRQLVLRLACAGVGVAVFGASMVVELAAKPDGAEISIGYADEWVDTASMRYVETPTDAHGLLALRGATWVRRNGATLQCEIEQYNAAQEVGVASNDLRVRVRWVYAKPAGSLTRRWYGAEPELLLRHRGPKIAIAAIYGAPRNPTSFDLQRVAEFGYASIAELADRIEIWNSSNELIVPLPLSAAAA